MNPFEFTELETVTVQMHELFMAYVQAGFTREEAVQLLIASVIDSKK